MASVVDELKKIQTTVAGTGKAGFVIDVMNAVERGRYDVAESFIKTSMVGATADTKAFLQQLLSTIQQGKAQSQIQQAASSQQQTAQNTLNQATNVPVISAPPPTPTVTAPPPTPITAPPTGYTVYKLQAGETLSGVAQKILGDPNRWREIIVARFGRPVNEDEARRLYVGETLYIPSPSAPPTIPTQQSVPAYEASKYQQKAQQSLDKKPFTLPEDMSIDEIVEETGVTIDEVERQLGYRLVPGQVIRKGTTIYVPRVPPQSPPQKEATEIFRITEEGLIEPIVSQQEEAERIRKYNEQRLTDPTMAALEAGEKMLKKSEGIIVGPGETYLELMKKQIQDVSDLLTAIAKGELEKVGSGIVELTEYFKKKLEEEWKVPKELQYQIESKLYDLQAKYYDKVADNLEKVYNFLVNFVWPSIGAIAQWYGMFMPGWAGLVASLIGMGVQALALTASMAVDQADILDGTLKDYSEKGIPNIQALEDKENLPETLF